MIVFLSSPPCHFLMERNRDFWSNRAFLNLLNLLNKEEIKDFFSDKKSIYHQSSRSRITKPPGIFKASEAAWCGVHVKGYT